MGRANNPTVIDVSYWSIPANSGERPVQIGMTLRQALRKLRWASPAYFGHYGEMCALLRGDETLHVELRDIGGGRAIARSQRIVRRDSFGRVVRTYKW